MARSIGVLATHFIWVGIVEDLKLGAVSMYPEPGQGPIDLKSMPTDEIIARILEQIARLHQGEPIDSVGAGFPGIVRCGVIDDSPNLAQLKGMHMQERLSAALKGAGIDAPVNVLNDADALAAGIAATQGTLEKLIRAWYLGDGIGYGRWPLTDSVNEGGHSVVTLDPKERFCGCGGQGHLEGIMGNRAMRLRFLDMEPEEVFAAAKEGNTRCADFVHLWHRALAAATASSVHFDGPGKFYLAGPNSDFVDLALVNRYLQDMVKMSPLQGSHFEVVTSSHDLALIGAAVSSKL
jgi:predicted NBD/HSP70 family sugar kinase